MKRTPRDYRSPQGIHHKNCSLRTSNQDDQKMSILQEHIRLLLDYPAMKTRCEKSEGDDIFQSLRGE